MKNKLNMKNTLLGLAFYLLSIQMGLAQANTIGTTGKWGSQIFLSDVNGRAFENKYADIVGSAYFLPDYKYASIVLTDGRNYDNVKAKVNLVENEIVFIASNGAEGYIGKGQVSLISFSDSTKQGVTKYIFQAGFPKIDNQTILSFYQVLCSGKASLLKSINKNIEERGNELSGEKYKEFITRENWYILKAGEMQRVKKDKAFFLAMFPEKSAELNSFITNNKINFKSEEQIIKLVTYFNSL
jgi:hydroxymethylpyrimidine pyrophosphatase-like HAD family hydrolase